MAQYWLKYDGMLRPMESSSSIGVNKVIRILKPADDRSIRAGFQPQAGDYVTYIVKSTASVVQESPTGGFDDATILELERVIVQVPHDKQIHFGG